MIAPFFAVTIAAVVAATPAAVPVPPALPIAGDLVRPGYAFDVAARANATRLSVTVTDPDKSSAIYAGIPLAAILRAAGAPTGDAVRGSAARAFVVVLAADGYSAIFSLAELQSGEPRCTPILADARAGLPLGADTGPLRIVAPCDLTHARWVRGVTSLHVVVTP